MNRRMAGRDLSLNAPAADVEDGSELLDRLADEHDDQEAVLADRQEAGLRGEHLARAVGSLGARERDIFVARRLSHEPRTLEQLSAVYGISPERVRQIEMRAFLKVADAVRSALLPPPPSTGEACREWPLQLRVVQGGLDRRPGALVATAACRAERRRTAAERHVAVVAGRSA